MRAEDVLPDSVNEASIDGVSVRKGTVAAFLANARAFAAPSTRATAEAHMREALPALRALGLFDVFEIRDPELRAWVAAHDRQGSR